MRSFIGAESHATWRARFSNSPRPEVEEALTIRTRCIVKLHLHHQMLRFMAKNSCSDSLKIRSVESGKSFVCLC
jgi:hypothetical protein